MPLAEARRFLHVCYCCGDAEAASRWLCDGLGLRVAMRTTRGKGDGSILGLPGPIETEAVFVFDARGPRTSPGIEVQEWIDPAPLGRPYADPHRPGIHALGIAVPDLETARERLVGLGCHPVGPPARAGEILGGRAASARDPLGIALDLVETGGLDGGETRLRHLRLSCSDLVRSLEWYAELGFEVRERHEEVSVPAGLFAPVPGRVGAARLRLPDEPLELVLLQWLDPPAAGAPYAEPNHAGLYRMAIAVDDTRDSVRHLEGAGRPIERSPKLVALEGTRVPEMWIAFLRDPDGIPVELVERPRSAFR
jgi:catechol 2,3-dioxygenase-like lactoylglutathione lyase family enzyme